MKSIFTALAPNQQWDDAWLAIKLSFLPWKWKRGPAVGQLREELKRHLGVGHLSLFETGRTGLEAILKCAGIGAGDEVLLQAFTCVAVPNAVIWTGARPVYVDCREGDFTMSVEDLKKKISPRAKAVIIQHTFGNIADIEQIKKIVGADVLVIEDCAHSLAMRGDLGFFSFGRDKVISSVFGGAGATHDKKLGLLITNYQLQLPIPSFWWIGRQLKYVANMPLIRMTIDWGIGKVLLLLIRAFGDKPVTNAEKLGKKPDFVGKQMPNALAILALHQFAKLDKFETHRKKITAIYKREFPNGSGILRFSLFDLRSKKIREEARQSRIFLGDWYTTAIAPAGVSYKAIGYDPSTCPTAERLAGNMINLPTDINITENDAERIISTIKRLGAI